MSAPAYAGELRRTVGAAAARLRALPAVEAAAPRAPGKWSPKQVIGHLVDSATNNHGRFVRALLSDALRFPGYDQEGWVEAQRYGDAAWPELVELWAALNLHLAWVMETAPEEARLRPRPDHALHELAWEAHPADRPATLDYFMRDYVEHLKHHLRQIDPALAAEPRPQRPLTSR